MDEDLNGQILHNLFIDYALLQIIVLAVGFLIWRKWIKSRKKIWTFLLIAVFGLYLAYSIESIVEIFTIEDLRIGGVTFAFEMMNLISGLLFVGIAGILAILARVKSRG